MVRVRTAMQEAFKSCSKLLETVRPSRSMVMKNSYCCLHAFLRRSMTSHSLVVFLVAMLLTKIHGSQYLH